MKYKKYLLYLGLFYALLPVRLCFSKKQEITKVKRSLKRQELIRYALQHNFSLKRFKARIKQAKAKMKGSLVFPNNPSLFASGGGQIPTLFGQNSSVLPRFVGGISLSIPVGGRWGKTQWVALSEQKQLKLQLKLKEYQTSIEVHLSLNEVALAYLKQKKRNQIVSFFRKIQGFVKKRLKYGVAIPMDVQLTKSSLLQAKQKFLAAQLRYRLRIQSLKTLLGWTSTQKIPWEVKDLPDLKPLPLKNRFFTEGLQNHVFLRFVRAKVRQSRANLALSKARAIPDVTFSLSYALEDNDHVVTGGISVPLPLFWRNQSRIGQNHARLHQARLFFAQQQFLVRQKMLRAYMQYRASLKMLSLFKKQNRTVKVQFKKAKKALEQGSLSTFQVLVSQQQLLENELLYIDNLKKAHNSYIRLCRSAGLTPAYEAILSTKK